MLRFRPLEHAGSSPAIAVAVSVAWLVACSRTRLPLGELGSIDDGTGAGAAGPGGAGPGATGGSGTAAGGEGGAGGLPPPPCSVVTLHEPVLTLAGGDMHHQRQPLLTESTSDGSVVTVVTEWTVVESPVDPPAELRHTSLLPWDDWPSDGTIEPTYLADLDRGVTFAASPSIRGRFAVLAGDGSKPSAPDGLQAHLVITPFSGALPESSGPIDEFADVAHFISPSPAGFLVGFNKQQFHEQTYFGIAAISDAGIDYTGPIRVACAAEVPSADAEPVGDTWMIAAASATGLASDDCFNTVLGAPDRVHVARVGPTGELDGGETFTSPTPVLRVRTAPHPEGMWVIWTEASGGAVPPIHGARVASDGTVVAGPFDLALAPEHFALSSSIAADHLGSRLVVAWIDDPAGNPPDVALAIHDGQAVLAETTYQPEGAIMGAVSVLGSPAGDAVLVAWSETFGRGQSRVRLARFDCAP